MIKIKIKKTSTFLNSAIHDEKFTGQRYITKRLNSTVKLLKLRVELRSIVVNVNRQPQ